MRYRERVAIQAPGEPERDDAGGVSYVFATVTGMGSIAATIMPRTEEIIANVPDDLMQPTEARWDVVLAGHWPEIETTWVVVAQESEAVFEVVRIVPTVGRRRTILRARRVDL